MLPSVLYCMWYSHHWHGVIAPVVENVFCHQWILVLFIDTVLVKAKSLCVSTLVKQERRVSRLWFQLNGAIRSLAYIQFIKCSQCTRLSPFPIVCISKHFVHLCDMAFINVNILYCSECIKQTLFVFIYLPFEIKIKRHVLTITLRFDSLYLNTVRTFKLSRSIKLALCSSQYQYI